MTLIVGIKCTEGIVVGADGAATLGNATGTRTVIQPVNKLHILQDRIVMGVSGQVGLGQLYCDRVEGLWRDNELGTKVTLSEVQRKLCGAIQQDAIPAIGRAAASIPFLGQGGAFALASTKSLVALPVGGPTGRSELIQCDHDGQAEAATDDLPYVAIGSGQTIADPHLALLRRVFWPDKLPNVADGIFAVMWTLLHAIQVNPGGVAEPIQLAVLERSKGKELRARELSKQSVEEHRQHVKDAEEHLRSFSDSQHDSSVPLPDLPA